jgi:hypothetical protein
MYKYHAITYKGRTQSLSAWSKELGIPYYLLHWRLKEGWPKSKLFTKPRPKERLLTCNGQTLSLRNWSKRTGVRYNTLRARLMLGWSVERTLSTPTQSKSSRIVAREDSALSLARQLRALSEALCLASCPKVLDPVRYDLRKRAEIIAADMPGVVKMFKHPLGTGGGSSVQKSVESDFSENRGSVPCL